MGIEFFNDMFESDDFYLDESIDFFKISASADKKVRTLIIYDIVENKKRVKLAKYLSGYGYRVQKSAFEAMLSDRLFSELKDGLNAFVGPEDSIRIYRIVGQSEVTIIGNNIDYAAEDTIIM